MAEQRDDGKPGNEPGTDIEPKASGRPAPALDEEQLRQFQQFQQFQDYLKFTEAQKQGIVPSQPAQPVPQQYGQPPVPPPPGELTRAPRPRAPRWLRRLGGKVIAWLIAILLIAIAGTIVYRQIFPSDEGKTSGQIAAEGGGKYRTNHVFSTSPYEAVRFVFHNVAQGRVDDACGRFQENIQTTFALDVGYQDCRLAVEGLHAQVTRKNDYAESLPSYTSEPVTGTTLTIDSCKYPIKGGPALGTFTVSQVEKGQWLITGHAPGPKTCAPLPPSTTPN